MFIFVQKFNEKFIESKLFEKQNWFPRDAKRTTYIKKNLLIPNYQGKGDFLYRLIVDLKLKE